MSKYVNFTAVDTTNDIYQVNEVRFDDPCFPGVKFGMTTNGCIDTDEYYRKEDYSMHVFSTMGVGMHAIYQNNVALPIRVNSNMRAMAGDTFPNTSRYGDSSLGIYVIEKYNISGDMVSDVSGLVDHYRMNISLKEDSKVWAELARKLERASTSFTPVESVSVRFVTFISKERMDKYKYVYVPNLNLGLVKGVPNRRVAHPLSKETEIGDVCNALYDEGHATSISIGIVDNDNPDKAYFINIGNEVQRVISETDELRPSGAIIVTKKDGEIINKRERHSIDALESIGIYSSEANALVKGDPKLILEGLKVNIAQEQLRVELLKGSSTERKSIVAALADNSKLRSAAISEVHEGSKREHERRVMKIGLKNEALKTKALKIKTDNDTRKSAQDSGVTALKTVTSLTQMLTPFLK